MNGSAASGEGDGRTHGLWARTAPPLEVGRLREPISVEVLVMGGGFTGLSAALHLSERGIPVAVLEAAHIGFGGSGRNVGLVNAGLWLEPDRVVELLGVPHGERLIELLGDAPQAVFDIIRRFDIACEGVRNGTLHCAVGARGREEIERRFKQWQARAAPVEILSAAQSAALLGTGLYTGALLDRRAGTIQPLAYVRGLAKAARSAGAQIFAESAVERIERRASGWSAITAQGSVAARWVVVATDVYATGPWQQVAREQIRLPYFNVATRPLPSSLAESILPQRQGCWDTQTVLKSFRMDAAGRLVFGSVGALRGTGTAVHRAWAKRSIRKLFPQIGELELEHEWYGSIGMTSDNVPRFHKLADHVIAVSGYNGRGIAPGTVFGRVIADYICGNLDDGGLPLPVTAVSEPRFRALREAAYELGSQAVHLMSAT